MAVKTVLFLVDQTMDIDRIFCINLSRRTDRWERMVKRFETQKIDVERFEAVTPADERVQETVNNSKTHSYKESNLRLAASTQSHYDIYVEALKRGYSRILVLEDDVRFHKYWKPIVEAQLKRLDADPRTKNWGILLLNAMRKKIHWTTPDEGFWQTAPGVDVMAGAYVITAAAMRAAVEHFCKRDVIPPDTMTVWVMRKFKSFVHMPWLAVQEHDESDVQTDDHNGKLAEWHIRNYYPRYGHLYDLTE